MSLHVICEIFSTGNQKIFIGGKLEIRIKKHSTFKKPILLKKHLYQNGKAQNMLVVAGRLVTYLNKCGTYKFASDEQFLDCNNACRF